VCEAMMIGMPIVALATTEMPTVLENGRSGIIDTDPERLIEGARRLLVDPQAARRLGSAAREIARERFAIERFVRDWNQVFGEVIGRRFAGRPSARAQAREEVTA
jgi:glycosyltransferase involved in cell wall biosynthesis